jgi:hypothetical protein
MSKIVIPRQLRYKDNHPTMVKFDKICQLADELGIHLSFDGRSTTIEDRDNKTPTYVFLEDIETDDCVNDFPPSLEFKMVRENPEFRAEQERLAEDHRKERDAREKKEREAAFAAEKARAEKAAKELEAKERRQLAELRKKYNE